MTGIKEKVALGVVSVALCIVSGCLIQKVVQNKNMAKYATEQGVSDLFGKCCQYHVDLAKLNLKLQISDGSLQATLNQLNQLNETNTHLRGLIKLDSAKNALELDSSTPFARNMLESLKKEADAVAKATTDPASQQSS